MENKIKEFPILYKYTSTGCIQQWQIFVQGNKFWTEEGLKNGKLTTSLPTFCKAKNKGKVNCTTAEQQALKEAESKFRKKKDKNYNEKLTKVKKFFEPMLAKNFNDLNDKRREDFFKERVFVQPKLDGLRCINDGLSLMSRNGKEYFTCPHLLDIIPKDSNIMLDGELYNHIFYDNFNEIVSIIKRDNPEKSDFIKSKEYAQYHVYDLPSSKGTFSKRYKDLLDWHLSTFKGDENSPIKIVPTIEVFSFEEIEKANEKFLELGYEGTIIRRDGMNYENKRTWNLLKLKEWFDDEYEIIEVLEGQGNRVGTVGKFVLKMNNGNTFKSNIKGPFSYLKELWNKKEELFGKMATVKYFCLTPLKDNGEGGVPKWSYVIKIDRESYE